MRHLADVLDQFNRRGIAVILVHHTSEHEFSTKPMGNTAISAMARWCVRFERRGDRLVLRQHGNYAAESETVASAPDGTIGFQLLGETGADDLAERRTARKRQRSKETADPEQGDRGLVAGQPSGHAPAGGRQTDRGQVRRQPGDAGPHDLAGLPGLSGA